MRPIQLKVRQITVDLDDPAAASRVEPALRGALETLGKKLQGSPLARDPDALDQAVALVALTPIPSSVLLGPGGPAAIAEQLYKQITSLSTAESRR